MNRQNWWRFTNRPNSNLRLFASQKSTSFEKEVKEPCSFLLFKRRDVGIPPYCILYGNGSSGRRPLRFLWIRAKLAVRRISLLPSAKISHCVSNISHAFAYITRAGRGGYHPPECLRIHQSSVSLRSTAIWLPREGAGERSETEGVNKGAKRQAILYKNRSEATLNYALRIANYTLYNRVRAEPFLNYSLFIIH